MRVNLDSLRKDELIILYLNLKAENTELRSRINKLIFESNRKEYHKEYQRNRNKENSKIKKK